MNCCQNKKTNGGTIKCYKIFGKNWYPGLMVFQLGFHISSLFFIPIGIWGLLNGCGLGLALIALFLFFEFLSFIWAFDDKLAKDVQENGYQLDQVDWSDL